jgi:hypothetical protein
MANNYHLNKLRDDFIGLYDRNSEEFTKDLERLLTVARIVGAEQEKHRIMSLVREKSIGIVVEAFDGDFKKIVRLAGDKLSKSLEEEPDNAK